MDLVLNNLDDTNNVVMEHREFPPSHHLVKIDSYALFTEHCPGKYESYEFETGGCKWKLVICPNGGPDGSYISAYLSLADQSPLDLSLGAFGVDAVFGIFLQNPRTKKFYCKKVSGEPIRFDTSTPAWGFSKFILKEMFLEPFSEYLDKGSCTFGAEVFTFNSPAAEHLSFKGVGQEYTCAWMISEYSKLTDEWKSEQFHVGGWNWCVALHPKGFGNNAGRNTAISLYLSEGNLPPHHKVKVKYTLRVRNQINERHGIIESTDWFEEPTNGFRYNEFIEIVDMTNELNGWVVNDCCIVDVAMKVLAVARRIPYN